MMAKEKAERPKMGDLIKQLPNVATPVQEVRPVETQKKIGRPEVVRNEPVEHMNAYPPESLAADMRMYKARTKKKLIDIMNEAFTEYLQKRGALTVK